MYTAYLPSDPLLCTYCAYLVGVIGVICLPSRMRKGTRLAHAVAMSLVAIEGVDLWVRIPVGTWYSWIIFSHLSLKYRYNCLESPNINEKVTGCGPPNFSISHKYGKIGPYFWCMPCQKCFAVLFHRWTSWIFCRFSGLRLIVRGSGARSLNPELWSWRNDST